MSCIKDSLIRTRKLAQKLANAENQNVIIYREFKKYKICFEHEKKDKIAIETIRPT